MAEAAEVMVAARLARSLQGGCYKVFGKLCLRE
jgi:hypothetical protein